jgi:hypothetical protein
MESLASDSESGVNLKYIASHATDVALGLIRRLKINVPRFELLLV